MAKLSIIIFASLIGMIIAAAPDSSNLDCAETQQCEPIKSSSTPQVDGVTCGAVSATYCAMYHAVRCCCQEQCQTATNPPPGAQQQQTGSKPGKGHGKKKCFHGDDLVETSEYGIIPMRELANRRDAHVLTRNDEGKLEFANVRYWSHAQPEMKAKFFILETESGSKLSISDEHLIYETDCRGEGGKAIFAKNTKIGRCVFVKNENGELIESRITQKREEILRGIYSPITSTGSIVVNNVLASCFNYYENEDLQKFVYNYVIGIQEFLANWLPTSIYDAAFNNQNENFVGIPRIVFNFLQLSKVFVH